MEEPADQAGDQTSPANFGVQYLGGVSHVGNQAVGSNAQAITVASHAPGDGAEMVRIAALFQIVEQLLQRHAAELTDAGDAHVTTRILQEELNLPSPSDGVVSRMLERLTAIAEPVAPLATVVAELVQAVRSVFGG